MAQQPPPDDVSHPETPAQSGTDRDFIQSLERGLAVLLVFDEAHPRPTLREIADITGFSRPAVRRILITLERLGYVTVDHGHWRLTPRVLSIGQSFAASHGIVDIAAPHLLSLTEQTRESSSLAMLDGNDVVYVARVQARRIMAMHVEVGTRLPTHATSMGRVLLAWAREDVVERVLSQPLEKLTENTVVDPVGLRDVLHHVRTLGYAVVDSELEDGFLSAAVPVRGPRGQVDAALAYSTSRGRQTMTSVVQDVVPLLLRTASVIEAELAATTRRRAVTPRATEGFY